MIDFVYVASFFFFFFFFFFWSRVCGIPGFDAGLCPVSSGPLSSSLDETLRYRSRHRWDRVRVSAQMACEYCPVMSAARSTWTWQSPTHPSVVSQWEWVASLSNTIHNNKLYNNNKPQSRTLNKEHEIIERAPSHPSLPSLLRLSMGVEERRRKSKFPRWRRRRRSRAQ